MDEGWMKNDGVNINGNSAHGYVHTEMELEEEEG